MLHVALPDQKPQNGEVPHHRPRHAGLVDRLHEDDTADLCGEVGEEETFGNVREAGRDGLEDGGVAQGGVVEARGVEARGVEARGVEARGVDEEGSGVGDGVDLGEGSTFVEGEKGGFNGWFFF